MSNPALIMLVVGLALIVVGLIGGGIEIKELKIPSVPMLPRVACFLVGCILTGWILYYGNLFSPSQADKRDDLGTAITHQLTNVHDVKKALKQLGMYSGLINNEPDGAYFRAVANFQQTRNIVQDGLVDGETYGKLREASPDIFDPKATTTPPATGPTTPSVAQQAGPQTPEPQVAKQDAPAPKTEAEVNPLCKIQPKRPSPGVDCSPKASADEGQICTNTNLCDLDWQLYSVYQVKKTSLDKSKQGDLAKAEGAWVKKRGECQSDARCIADRYKSRISELQ